FPTQASNCVLPGYVVGALLTIFNPGPAGVAGACDRAYRQHIDPYTGLPYDPDTDIVLSNRQHYFGFDPLSVDPSAPANVNNGLGLAPNNGEGFAKDLSGNELPNAPPFTISAGAQYSMPLTTDWAGT